MKIKNLFLALVIGTLAFASCKKQEADIQPQHGDRTPIAMRDASGNIVSTVSIDEIQARFNQTAERGDENIVIESYRITEPTADHPYFLTIDYIDANEEKAYSVAFIGEYVEEIMNYYYMTNDMKTGNFSVQTRKDNQSKALVTFTNGEVEVNDNPTPDMLPPSWCVRCEKQFCQQGTCAPTGGHGDYYCSDCVSTAPEGHQPICNASYYNPNGLWGILWRMIASI